MINVPRVGRERIRDSISFAEQGRTKQSFRDETDVNLIMARFEKTGVMEHAAEFGGDYGDVAGSVPYHEALNIARRAEGMFADLPAKVRGKFFNDPGVFLASVEDPAMRPGLIELGILPPDEPLASVAAPAAAPAPAVPTSPAPVAATPEPA